MSWYSIQSNEDKNQKQEKLEKLEKQELEKQELGKLEEKEEQQRRQITIGIWSVYIYFKDCVKIKCSSTKEKNFQLIGQFTKVPRSFRKICKDFDQFKQLLHKSQFSIEIDKLFVHYEFCQLMQKIDLNLYRDNDPVFKYPINLYIRTLQKHSELARIMKLREQQDEQLEKTSK